MDGQGCTAGCVVGIAVSVASMAMLYSPGNPSRAYYGTETRAHQLLIGALVSVLVLRLRLGAARPRLGSGIAAVGGIVLLAAFAGFADTNTAYYRGGSTLVATCTGLLGTRDRSSRARRALPQRPSGPLGGQGLVRDLPVALADHPGGDGAPPCDLVAARPVRPGCVSRGTDRHDRDAVVPHRRATDPGRGLPHPPSVGPSARRRRGGGTRDRRDDGRRADRRGSHAERRGGAARRRCAVDIGLRADHLPAARSAAQGRRYSH